MLLRPRGHDDDGGLRPVTQPANHVEPVAVGQAEIDEHHFGRCGHRGLRGGGGAVHLEAGLGQNGHQTPRHAVVILDDGNPHTGRF
nr:hypothetical protein GCM10020092_022280 [Actinoplanes digitatis]